MNNMKKKYSAQNKYFFGLSFFQYPAGHCSHVSISVVVAQQHTCPLEPQVAPHFATALAQFWAVSGSDVSSRTGECLLCLLSSALCL